MSRPAFRPKQSLGQNFLKDENIARKIVSVLNPGAEDTVVEIGPGFGVLTAHTLPVARKVVAVEIDGYLAEGLRQRFSGSNNLELVNGDFLKLDLEPYREQGRKLRVLGNIPYHITSPVIFKVLDIRKQVRDMVMMIQREVAGRIVAPPRCKAYGILSVCSQLYSVPKIAFHVSRNVFSPKPDVDSSVVHWDFSAAPDLKIKDEDHLRLLIRVSFNQRRKMLRKSLQRLPGFLEVAGELDFDLTKRPEELGVAEFVELSNQMVNRWKTATS